MTLAAVMYNLITDVVGGVEVVVLEESLAPLSVAPGAPPRRFAAPSASTTNGAVTAPVAPSAVPPVPSDEPTEEVRTSLDIRCQISDIRSESDV